jgi:hypothetical protein
VVVVLNRCRTIQKALARESTGPVQTEQFCLTICPCRASRGVASSSSPWANTARPGTTSVAVVGGILAAMLLLPLSVVSAAAIEFGLASTASAVLTGVAGSYTVQQATYYSAPITLEAGHMVFTDSDKTRLKMPEGEYAITYFIVCH